jgi:hypothetical protein
VSDGHGGFSFAAEVPVYTPGSGALRGPLRPFWQVDLEVSDAAVPPGRGIPGHVLSAVSGPTGADWVRSSQAGVSFVAHSMGFVPGSASLRQAVARPRLRYPGMGRPTSKTNACRSDQLAPVAPRVPALRGAAKHA